MAHGVAVVFVHVFFSSCFFGTIVGGIGREYLYYSHLSSILVWLRSHLAAQLIGGLLSQYV